MSAKKRPLQKTPEGKKQTLNRIGRERLAFSIPPLADVRGVLQDGFLRELRVLVSKETQEVLERSPLTGEGFLRPGRSFFFEVAERALRPSPLFAGVAACDDLPEVGDLDPGVALGGLKALVSEKTLDVADVGPSF